MKAITEKLPQRVRQVGWFIAIWTMSVAVLGLVAYFIRFWLGLA